MSLNPELQGYQQRIETVLENVLPSASVNPDSLHQAMRYSVLDGGKRIRPLLVYATGDALGLEPELLDIPAAAIELIHVYSLIHDDLPAMDDDDLRRGKPTCHIAFDEATAILAGDALQALSSHIIVRNSHPQVTAEARLRMLDILTHAAGSRGMVGGQAIDLAFTGNGQDITEPQLENMHVHKTGALIRACVQMACACADDIAAGQSGKLDQFAKTVGLAFQVRDDILDIESNTETLGKPQGADIAADKATYPAIIGLAEARSKAQALHNDAIGFLNAFDEKANNLRDIAEFIVNRLK